MSPAEVLVIVVVALFGFGVLLFIVKQVYDYRYIWRDGYYRIVLYNVDRHIISVTKRLVGVRSFELVIEGIKHSFEIDPDYHFTQGRFKVRTLHYVLGDLKVKGNWIQKRPDRGLWAEPIDPLSDDPPGDADDRSSIEFNTVANNRVTSQLMDVFNESFLGTGASLILLGIVMLIAIGAMAVYMNTGFSELQDQIATLQASQTRFESNSSPVLPGGFQ